MAPFPDEIKRFLDANIESLDQLEILRVLGENPDRGWPATALAEILQSPPATVASHLAALHGRGLLTATGPTARYGPATPALADLVGRLLQLYKERPVSMIKLVYARAKDPLRSFADAFRLRPPEDR